jgi:hypothetical protein
VQQKIDSLEKVNLKLNEEIYKTPEIISIGTITINRPVTLPDGTTQWNPETTITRTPKPNPRIKDVEMNDKNLERLREQKDIFTEKKMEAANDLRKELSENVGFLEELNAMLRILGERPEALVFYLCIFSFLVSLELFVVASKWGDKKCDYDLILEYRLNTKKEALDELVKKTWNRRTGSPARGNPCGRG